VFFLLTTPLMGNPLYMVRAGVVSYPCMWPSCGYNEIQEPRRKDVLIDYERLQKLLGAGSYDELRRSHKGWIEEYLGEDERARREEWTDSIAVGSVAFVEKVKELLGFRAKGREVTEAGEGFQLREEPADYTAFFQAQNDDMGPKNTFFWDLNAE